MKKGFMRKCFSLLCMLLICSIVALPVSAAVSGGKALDAFSDGFADVVGERDLATLATEPAVAVGSKGASLSNTELRSLKLYPGGVPFGVKFMTEGALIVGFCDLGRSGNPSSAAGLRVGDRIIAANGRKISSSAELCDLLKTSGGASVSIVYLRGESEHTATLTPVYSESEKCYKSGMYLKDNGAGLGTVTYIVPDSLEFAGLGHGICESESGRLTPISRGSVVNVGIDGVVKGLCGTPGELKGHFKSGKCGSLLQNTECGVFGILTSLPENLPSAPLSLGLRGDVREGKAHIYCTLEGNFPQKYEIEIANIDRSASAGKCFNVKVTDPALLEKTGGIVQGMSGSPIIQNGKLIGAVTHVMINDPTTGYGIFIENMLTASAARNELPKAA
ncbi:MAG: SpoIVB peptidase [Clostridia bacterium]|nr:SpoIVB peptidase [Clostridia bacterium]